MDKENDLKVAPGLSDVHLSERKGTTKRGAERHFPHASGTLKTGRTPGNQAQFTSLAIPSPTSVFYPCPFIGRQR